MSAPNRMWKHARAQTVDFTSLASKQSGGSRPQSSAASRPRSATTATPAKESVQESTPASPVQRASKDSHYQRFVLSDPVAFGYLESDPLTSVVDRAHVLEGYQSYIVEQWVVSRTHPTFMITSFTGDPNHKITVGVLCVPADEESWSPRLKVYFKSLAQYHAKRKETPVGILMVTNIAGFPSSLALIAVPGGDVKKHREDFFVNENLKRLGCMGRSGISLGNPSGPTQAKFHQLFKTSEKVDLYTAVVELVKLCQAALMLFDELEPEYADGLLCDMTERALHKWWDDIGAELYNVEPKDGIVGPTTVSALLGTLIGARNRLHAYGAPVSKDVFDIDATKRAVNHFQKGQHLQRTRRLDRNTMLRLHKVTAKHASAESWLVPRAVKSTMAELSGKGGEMVMDMVGRDKASLAEIETTDIERFAQLVKGAHAKWLWQGKAKKMKMEQLVPEPIIDISSTMRTSIDEEQDNGASEFGHARTGSSQSQIYQPSPDQVQNDPRRLAMWKRPARFTRAAAGAAAGKMGHHPHHSRDTSADLAMLEHNKSIDSIVSVQRSGTDEKPENFFEENKTSHRRHMPMPRFSSKREHHRLPSVLNALHSNHSTGPSSSEDVILEQPARESQETNAPEPEEEQEDLHALEIRPSEAVRNQLSAAEQVQRETDFDAVRQHRYRPAEETGVLLRRARSLSRYWTEKAAPRNASRYPRHLSFSTAEDALSRPESKSPFTDPLDGDSSSEADDALYAPDAGPRRLDAAQALDRELHRAVAARRTRAALARAGGGAGTWLLDRIHVLTDLDRIVSNDTKQLAALYAPRRGEHAQLAEGSTEIVGIERGRISDGLRDVETLGQRLEYEIAGLSDKVEDAESAVAEFERQVLFVEERVAELVRDGEGGAGAAKARKPPGFWTWVHETLFGVEGGEVARRQKEVDQDVARDLSKALGEKKSDSPAGVDALSAKEEQASKAAQRERLEEQDTTPFTSTKQQLQAMVQR